MTIYFYGNIKNFNLTVRKLEFRYKNFNDYMKMSLKFNGGKKRKWTYLELPEKKKKSYT